MTQMTTCTACGTTISVTAKACPVCAHPLEEAGQERPSGPRNVAIVILSLIIIAATGTLIDRLQKPEAPSKPLSEAQIKAKKIQRQFNGWDGAHRQLERTVEASLKDPNSYQHIETRYRDNGESITVIMKYRAKNSFGGYVVNTVVATYGLEGSLVEGPISLNE